MRGLTLEEAWALTSSDPSRSAVSYTGKGDPAGPDLRVTLDGLHRRGCVSRGEWLDEQGEPWTGYTVTDLGRLALRVSVPGAPVPIG